MVSSSLVLLIPKHQEKQMPGLVEMIVINTVFKFSVIVIVFFDFLKNSSPVD